LLALRALRKRKPQETQALALASNQSWLPLLRPSIPIGCCLQPIGCSVEAVAAMIGCFPTQALAFSQVSIQTQRTQRNANDSV